jgi:hypothetical protein
MFRNIERLDADLIAREDQLVAARIMDRNREHAVQAGRGRHPFGMIEIEDDLGVRSGPEDIASGFKLGAQRLEIVDLAVEDNGDAIRSHHRLVTGAEIDDRQPPHRQGKPGCKMHAGIVGSTMDDRRVHGGYTACQPIRSVCR